MGKLGDINLGDLPGIRQWKDAWGRVPFANRAVRREAKAVLLRELAEAVRHRMPLAEALELAGQDEGDRAPGADEMNRWGRLLLQLGTLGAVLLIPFLLPALLAAAPLYLLVAGRCRDTGRVARVMARVLGREVQSGHSLAGAMRSSGLFTEAEEKIVAFGEKTGRLDAALRALSDHQRIDARLLSRAGLLIHPVFLCTFVTIPISFILTKVMPRYDAVMSQLNAPMTGLSAGLADWSSWLGDWILLPLLPAFALLAFYLLRLLMNGSRTSLSSVATTIVAVPTVFSLLVSFGLVAEFGGKGLIAAVIVTGVLVPGGIAATPVLVRWLEFLVVSAEELISLSIRPLPLVGAAARARDEAMWMAMLSLCAHQELPASEALERVAETCPPGLANLTRKAAGIVGQGRPLGEACAASRVLRGPAAWRLRMLDGHPEYQRGLRELAVDVNLWAIRNNETMLRMLEIAVVLTVGALLGSFLYAVYMPLILLPTSVGGMP